jgi:DNA processing protein
MFTSDQLRDHIRLASVPGIGPRFRKLLLERFGSPAGIFAASPAELQSVARLGKKLIDAITASATSPAADEVIRLCQKQAVDIVLEGSEGYPPLLSRIDDPPGLLFVRGAFLPCDALAVAVVGARHATPYGIKVAEQFGGSLARAGYTVVSGLARGIDAAAHRGAIAAGGRTIAVLGSGVLNVYPPEHEDLAAEVAKHGALDQRSAAAQRAVQRRISATQPDRVGHVARHGRRAGGGAVGRADHVAAGRRAGPRGLRGAGADRLPAVGRLPCADPRWREARAPRRRHSRGIRASLRDGDDPRGRAGGKRGRTAARQRGAQRARLRRQGLDHGRRDRRDIRSLAASQVLSTLSVLEMRRLVRRMPGNRIERM